MNILLLSNYVPFTTAVLLKRGFEEAGHYVFPAGPMESPDDWVQCDAEADVRELLRATPCEIDFILFVEASTGKAFFPSGLLEAPVPTAFWAIDNHVNFAWHRSIAGVFDITLVAQKDFLAKARREMTSIVEWLPLAADPEWHFAPSVQAPSRSRDVVFVGHLDQRRTELFAEIKKSVPGFEAHSGVYGARVGKLYAEAKIGLNSCINGDLNMRFFEVLASGALLLTEDIDGGMRDLFTEGEHFAVYERSEAGPTVRRWLEDSEKRMQIAQCGQARCMAHHTYRHRADSIVHRMAEHSSQLRQRRTSKSKSALLALRVATTLRSAPFSMEKEAWRWLRLGLRSPGMITAFPELLRYLKRSIAARFRNLLGLL